ncbi:MAG: MBL fold metallo-hydrolase [Eubacteriales bacterium]|nr:MBL fold metallo-hydrolase [Eubacteriales bacterium]
MLKRILAALLGLGLCAPLQGCSTATLIEKPTGEMHIAFLGDKAEDAILLYGEDFAVLVDTGLNKTGQEIVDYLQKKNITSLDLLLVTHYDKDHVGGADAVLEQIDIGLLIGPDYESDAKQYEQFVEEAEKSGVAIERLREDRTLSFGGLTLHIDAPKTLHEQENDRSLVVRAEYGECSLLLAGDAEKDRIRELLRSGLSPCTLLKVPHHGRIEDNSLDFFEALRPELAVITSHEEEPEHEEVVSMLEELGAQVFLTRLGLVEGSCDGHVIKLWQTPY